MTVRRPFSDAERLDWLRLSRSENVGPITFFALLQRLGSAGAALDALPELARRGGRSGPIRIATRSAAAREIEAIARLGGRLIARDEPDYPVPLAAIADAPPLIIVRGDFRLLARPTIAMVGARNASANGVRFATMLAADLGAACRCFGPRARHRRGRAPGLARNRHDRGRRRRPGRGLPARARIVDR